jgi:hypothetical protein
VSGQPALLLLLPSPVTTTTTKTRFSSFLKIFLVFFMLFIWFCSLCHFILVVEFNNLNLNMFFF